MSIKYNIIIALSVLLLNGCTSSHIPTPVTTTYEPNAKLAEAATSISQSLNNLTEVQEAATPPLQFNAVPDAGFYQLPGVISVDWAGPVEPLLQRIAKVTGYRLRVLGVRPAIPVVVSVTAKETPVGSVVRDIAFQADKAATVWVYPAKHIIELRYLRV